MDAAASLHAGAGRAAGNRELKVRTHRVLLEAKDYGRAAGFAGDARKQHPNEPVFPRLQGARCSTPATGAADPVLESAVKSFPKDTADVRAGRRLRRRRT